MRLLEWYNKKKAERIKYIQDSRKDFNRKWNNFLIKETYLCNNQQKDLSSDVKRIREIGDSAWYFFLSKDIRKETNTNKAQVEEWKDLILRYNSSFVNHRLKEHKSYFDGKDNHLKFGLDEDQRRAVVVDDMHNLVIAGAGSGKTAVLTSKIAYLTKRKDKIDPSEILVLAFNRDAISEIKYRLNTDYNIKNVNVMNFHQLGFKIIKESTMKLPRLFGKGDSEVYNQKISEIIENLLKDKSFQELFLEYLSNYLEEDNVSFDEKEEYHAYMRNKKYKTFNNLTVKSISERNIANFLFRHNIEFEYEPSVDWVDKYKDANYNPDFYLPKYDIYIEHWGLSKDNKVPDWFEGDNPTEKYLRIKDWKLNQFNRHNKELVETWDYERNDGTLLKKLEKRLRKKNSEIKFSKLSYEQLVNKTYATFKGNKKEITNMVSAFVGLCKTNSFNESEIRRRIKSKDYTCRQIHFASMSVEVYIKYQEFLRQSDQIDFNDMIIDATEILRKDSQKFKNKYEYILVDEFQDISKPRIELLKALLALNPKTKLFCVGDDWQSINGFAGSELDYFVKFDKEFQNPEELALRTNYRSSKVIVEMSNKLISYNKNKINKEVHYDIHSDLKDIRGRVIVNPEHYLDNESLRIESYVRHLKLLLANGIHPKDILVLSRFNRILNKLRMACEQRGINIEDPHEKKKGVRLRSVHKSKGLESKYVILIDVISGTYGFPSEIKDSSVLEIAKKKNDKNSFEEERRLFYVALTRAKERLDIFTVKGNQSLFLSEIKEFV